MATRFAPRVITAAGPRGRLRPGTVGVLIRVSGTNISVHPKRPVKIYFKRPGMAQGYHPTWPSQVAWSASGLPKGRQLFLVAKRKSNFGYMRSECYGPLVSGRVLLSGPPRKGPAVKGTFVRWRYSIVLTNASGAHLSALDPGVDIGNDP